MTKRKTIFMNHALNVFASEAKKKFINGDKAHPEDDLMSKDRLKLLIEKRQEIMDLWFYNERDILLELERTK